MNRIETKTKPRGRTTALAASTAGATDDGLHFPGDALIAANARTVTPDDPFFPPVIRLLRMIMHGDRVGKRHQLIQWPDGLVAAIPAGLTGGARDKALADAYHRAFQNLLSELPE